MEQYRYTLQADGVIFFISGDPGNSLNSFALTHPGQLSVPEGPCWLDESRMPQARPLPGEIEASIKNGKAWAVNLGHPRCVEPLCLPTPHGGKKRVNVVALGDVGGMLVTALRLLGGDTVARIGIYDVNPKAMQRYEYELNQIAYPWDYDRLPEVALLAEGDLFDCDVFVFCATRAIPPLGSEGVTDVRMAQLAGNAAILKRYAQMARARDFRGLFAVVSDPVDALCRAAYLDSNKNSAGELDYLGLRPEQIQGYGLGVMNARAAYYAKKDARFAPFLQDGRAFGPHGASLVIANSIADYDDALSRELTTLAVEANLRTRETGFKPFIAPALSSGAISLLLTMQGAWHYGAVPLGGVYFGCKTRFSAVGLELEQHAHIPDPLFARLQASFAALRAIELPE